jgi:hypothetical protein
MKADIPLAHFLFSWHYLQLVSLEHKGQAIPTMSAAEFYHILMSNIPQWMYKEVQVVMVN